MVIRKSRRTKRGQAKRRQTKRKQMKRKYTKKTHHKRERNLKKAKKIYGGKFNPKDRTILMEKLGSMGFTEEEKSEIMNKLDLGAHYFSGDDLRQLLSQIQGMNKQQLKTWLETHYSLIAEDDETDYESD